MNSFKNGFVDVVKTVFQAAQGQLNFFSLARYGQGRGFFFPGDYFEISFI
ncbi:MAG: hypothetical protein ACR2H1_07615 [Limisphaerales bacterium]